MNHYYYFINIQITFDIKPVSTKPHQTQIFYTKKKNLKIRITVILSLHSNMFKLFHYFLLNGYITILILNQWIKTFVEKVSKKQHGQKY